MHDRKYHVFPSKNFCLSVRIFFVIDSYCFWKIFSFRNGFKMKRGGASHFSVEKTWSHSAEKNHKLPCNLSEKMWFREKLCILGVSRFSVENFRSDSGEKRVGLPSMFQKLCGNRKILCIVGVSQFSAGICLSHGAENFCKGILLSLRKFLVSKSFYGWKEGAHHIFPSKKHGPTVPKNFVSITAKFQKKCGIGKFYL